MNESSSRHSFCCLEPPLSDYAPARFAILPIPYDATVSFQSGTRRGPDAIIAASDHLEDYDEELGTYPCESGIAVLPPVIAPSGDPHETHEAIYAAAKKVVADGKFLFGFGGEHGVTSGLVRAVAEREGKISILQLDAHLDLRDSYQGSKWSHASVMRRCLEHAEKLVPVGIRNVCAEELEFMPKAGITPIMAAECARSDDWIGQVIETLGDKVYVTVDIDGFDPAYAPGTGTPVPGGLEWYQVMRMLRAVAKTKKIVAADVVEVMPIPGQAVTEFLAARVAYRIMGYVLGAEQGIL
ncbi:MAG: agmatinase [Phycisphaerales bacterium]|nr:agmatinase [Phycisphaerales bacterium]